MTIQATSDAIKLVKTLLKYVDENKIVDLLKELDIHIEYGFDEDILECDNTTLRIILFNCLKYSIDDIFNLSEDYPEILNILDKNDLDNYAKNKPQKLISFLTKNCKIYGWSSVRDLFRDWYCEASHGKYYHLDDLSDACVLSFDKINIDKNCPFNMSIVKNIIFEAIKDDFISPVDDLYIRQNYIMDYIEYYIENEYNDINLQQYIVIDQVEKHQDELKEECNLTLDEFKELRFINSKELAVFLLDYTNLAELVEKDWF